MVDIYITVSCKGCGNVMHRSEMHKKVESFRQAIGVNSLAFVYGCMQGDLGASGAARIASSLGCPVKSYSYFKTCKKRIEYIAGKKFEEVSEKVIDAIFDYYREKLDKTPNENGILSVEVGYE